MAAIVDSAAFVRDEEGLLSRDPLGGVDEDGAPCPLGARVFAVDAASAFSFLVRQLDEIWQQCCIWRSRGSGRAVWMVCWRMIFGGRAFPQRWTRVFRPVEVEIALRIKAFQDSQPMPAAARVWMEERARELAAGRLPAGSCQLSPVGLSTFIDDLGGAALNYPVELPAGWSSVGLGEAATRSVGGVPGHPRTMAGAAVVIAVQTIREVSLDVGEDKTMLGDGVVSLGLQCASPLVI